MTGRPRSRPPGVVYPYYGFLSTGNSIAGQSPETTAETNPVWWQIVLGSLQRGFDGLFEMPCEQPPGFGYRYVCSQTGEFGTKVSKVSGP